MSSWLTVIFHITVKTCRPLFPYSLPVEYACVYVRPGLLSFYAYSFLFFNLSSPRTCLFQSMVYTANVQVPDQCQRKQYNRYYDHQCQYKLPLHFLSPASGKSVLFLWDSKTSDLINPTQGFFTVWKGKLYKAELQYITLRRGWYGWRLLSSIGTLTAT